VRTTYDIIVVEPSYAYITIWACMVYTMLWADGQVAASSLE